MTRSFQAILFDYGHTLVDFTVPEDALYEVYETIRERLLEEARTEVPEAPELIDRVARAVTQQVDDSYKRDRLVELDILGLFGSALGQLGLSPSEDLIRWVAEAEHTALTKHLVVPQQTLHTLATLHESGLKIGLVSNAHLLPYMMRRDWDNLGIGRFVDASVVSSEVGIRKPHPDIFKQVLEQLRTLPEDAIFVGDRLMDDVGGSQALGMTAVLSREFRQEEVVPGGPQPALVISSLEEVTPLALSQAA